MHHSVLNFTGKTSRVSFKINSANNFNNVHTGPDRPQILLHKGYWVFPGVKRPGRHVNYPHLERG